MQYENDVEMINAVGEALYGSGWVSTLAFVLEASESSVRAWSDGSHPIPDHLKKGIAVLVEMQINLLHQVRRNLISSGVKSPSTEAGEREDMLFLRRLKAGTPAP